MAEVHSVQSPPVPAESRGSPEPCPPDCDLPENSQENLDARLDHAIEETFPTSDPISVTITKQAAEVPRETASTTAESQHQAEQETTEELLDQVRGALQDVAQTTSGTLRETYREGLSYVQQIGDRYPETVRSNEEGRQALHQRITENPWLYLFAAAAGGYLLGLLIHGGSRGQDQRVPDYARTRRSYASYRDDQQG